MMDNKSATSLFSFMKPEVLIIQLSSNGRYLEGTLSILCHHDRAFGIREKVKVGR